MGQSAPFTNMVTLAVFERYLISKGAMVYEPDRRRSAPRVVVHQPASIGLAVNDFEYRLVRSGWCTDISRNGIGLMVEEEFVPLREEDLLVCVDALVGRRCHLPVRMIYCKQVLKRTWRIGATFLC